MLPKAKGPHKEVNPGHTPPGVNPPGCFEQVSDLTSYGVLMPDFDSGLDHLPNQAMCWLQNGRLPSFDPTRPLDSKMWKSSTVT